MTTGGFRRLPRQDDGQQEQDAAPAAPKGWGKPAAAAPAAAPAQREAIRARVSAPVQQAEPEAEQDAPPTTGRGFFSRGVQAQLAGDTAGVPEEAQPEPAPEKATKPRAPRAAKVEPVAEAEAVGAPTPTLTTVTPGAPHFYVSFSGVSNAGIKAALLAIAASL